MNTNAEDKIGLIFGRRSIRLYSPEAVSEAVVKRLLGLGACWLGVHPREQRMSALKQILLLPPSVIPVACIAVGHPGETKEPRARFNRDYVHSEKW
jgi:nitroreductase